MDSGLPASKIAQIRGFADQRLRFPNEPHNPGNRRISVIVQYRDRKETGVPAQPDGDAAHSARQGANGNSSH
jgi:chemotaxis protein MotB